MYYVICPTVLLRIPVGLIIIKSLCMPNLILPCSVSIHPPTAAKVTIGEFINFVHFNNEPQATKFSSRKYFQLYGILTLICM